jgi:hypothetical protein
VSPSTFHGIGWWALPRSGIASQGATINVISSNNTFHFGGGHCRTHWQHPLEGPPSTSSLTSVVAATRPTDNTC